MKELHAAVSGLRRIVAGLALSAFVAFGAQAQSPDDNRLLSPEDARADFKALYAGLQSAHYDLYVDRPKADYDALYRTMLKAIDKPEPVWRAAVRFQTFAAYGNVAHARIEFPDAAYKAFRDAGGKAFPVSLRIVNGHAYVAEGLPGIAALTPGSEIARIDGIAMEVWLARASANISADTPYIAHSLLEFMFPQYMWLLKGEVPAFHLTLTGAKGPIDVEVPALTREQLKATPVSEAKFSLDTPLRDARLLEGGVAYLKPGPFYNAESPENLWDAAAFKNFIDKAFEGFIKDGAKVLIIDVRQNPGGDNSFSDTVVGWIADRPFRFNKAFRVKSSLEAKASNQARLDKNPGGPGDPSWEFARKYETTPYGQVFDFDLPYARPHEGQRFAGKVYVLTNRHSYSDAVSIAAIVQDYGFGKIIGEKTTDMATTYGAMETFKLPHSGLTVGFPKAHIIRPSGDLKSDGVTPDIVIETPIVATTEDEVLKRALAAIKTAS